MWMLRVQAFERFSCPLSTVLALLVERLATTRRHAHPSRRSVAQVGLMSGQWQEVEPRKPGVGCQQGSFCGPRQHWRFQKSVRSKPKTPLESMQDKNEARMLLILIGVD